MQFAQNHSIETPEQTNLEFTLAGVGSRFLALLIDSLIQFGVLLLIGVVLAIIGGAGFFARLPLTGAWMIAGFLIGLFLLFYGYFIFFEIFWSGQTPGKRKIGIRVIKDTGRRLSAFETIGRNLLRILDQAPGFYAIGILVAFLNKQNKRLGDFVAGSIVVREASLSEIKRTWNDPDFVRTPYAPLGAQSLTDEDVILIESFLQRRHQLAPDIRWRMADGIFKRLESKLIVSAEERAGVERVLELAVHERRSAGGV